MKNTVVIIGSGLIGNSLAKRLSEHVGEVILIEKPEQLSDYSFNALTIEEAECLLDSYENQAILDSPTYLRVLDKINEPVIRIDYPYHETIINKSFYQMIPDSRAYKKHKKRK